MMHVRRHLGHWAIQLRRLYQAHLRVGKIVIAFTLVPLLGYTGVIVAEPIVWFIMVIPLLVKIYTMPVLRKQGHGI